jgi:intracellular sulfur oxidation DsrE/DsrF family protein
MMIVKKMSEDRMKKIILLLVCALLAATEALAAPVDSVKALEGLKRVNIICDMNVGEPKLLLKRMELLDRTYRQLEAAGVKTTVVVAFRGKASVYITKGDGYVPAQAKNAKREARSWIERFRKSGFVIEQCAIAARMLNIELKDFLPEVEIVQNGYVSIVGYQQQGYAFLPMD